MVFIYGFYIYVFMCFLHGIYGCSWFLTFFYGFCGFYRIYGFHGLYGFYVFYGLHGFSGFHCSFGLYWLLWFVEKVDGGCETNAPAKNPAPAA